MLLLCIKMFGGLPLLNQVHIPQIGFRATKIQPLEGTPAIFPTQEVAHFLVGAFKIPCGDSPFQNQNGLAGTDASSWL